MVGASFLPAYAENESTDLRRLSDGLELGGSSYRRSQLGMTVRSPSPILALCRQLVESSTYASSTPLDAYRGDMLCLRVRSIGEAAKLEIDDISFCRIRGRRRARRSPTDSFSA